MRNKYSHTTQNDTNHKAPQQNWMMI